MGENHSEDKDQRPKRRIDRDNPYRLFTVGAATSEPHYFIQFKDGAGIEHCLEIEKPLYDLFDEYELDDLSYLNEVDNHYEHSELTEATLRKRAVVRPEDVEAVILRQMDSEQLHIAISRLPEIQRRRLTLYYYGELTHQQIADIEGCAREVVTKSIKKAIRNLKNFLD